MKPAGALILLSSCLLFVLGVPLAASLNLDAGGVETDPMLRPIRPPGR